LVTRSEDERQAAELTRRRTIACLSVAPHNPYLRLLYGHLAAHGFELTAHPAFSLRWLWRERRGVGILHFHWPESLYRYGRGPRSLRPALSRAKLGLFAARLAAARALGYRLVWTVHQLYPHESSDRALDRLGACLLGRACHLLTAHDTWTAAEARSELAIPAEKIVVVPHGSYIGVYPEGRSRSEVRSDLGLPPDSFVFLCFGELRAHKEIELLLAAFAAASTANRRLIVAGNPKIASIGEKVRAAAANDPSIVALLDFVPEERVAELFHACDAAVLPRGEEGTSGSLVLALSMGLPVVAANVSTARALMHGEEAGWLFRPHDVSSLEETLERAGSDRAEALARGRHALTVAAGLDWAGVAGQFARLLHRISR
jgi:beta-1,4-mannosyltransferase